MKTATKAMIIIGIIIQFYMIYPLVLGIIAIQKLNSAQKSADLKGWSIVTLLFVSLIGGILMMNIPDEAFAENYVPTQPIAVPVAITSPLPNQQEEQPAEHADDRVKNFIWAELIDEL